MKRQGCSGIPLCPAPCVSRRPLSTLRAKPTPPVTAPPTVLPRPLPSEITVLNGLKQLKDLVVRAVASRSPLFARYDAEGRGVWIAKGSVTDAVLHPNAVILPVLNELYDLDNLLRTTTQVDALIAHYEMTDEGRAVRIQRCLQDEEHQDPPIQAILKEMARVATDAIAAQDMAEADLEGRSQVLINCMRAIKGCCELTAALGAEVVANMVRHRNPLVLRMVHDTPELVEGLQAMMETIRADCPHLGQQMAKAALEILGEEGELHHPLPPSVHEVRAAGQVELENERLARENLDLMRQNDLLKGTAIALDVGEDLRHGYRLRSLR